MPKTIYPQLCALTVFRNILELPLMKSLTEVLRCLWAGTDEPGAMIKAYSQVVYDLFDEEYASLTGYIEYHLKYDDSPYGRALSNCEPGTALKYAAREDLRIINRLCEMDCSELKAAMISVSGASWGGIIRDLTEWRAGEAIKLGELNDSYSRRGCGTFSAAQAYKLDDGEIIPVKNPDSISFAEMIGYEWQHEQVLNNTLALVEENYVNNILLYGDSGTGKSATVKSLINEPALYKLRIIEVTKDCLWGMQKLIRELAEQPQFFVIFIDDLSFEGGDAGFAALKTVLEGGLEMRPQNVAIYATSNRRHLVKETLSDRAGDYVHVEETLQEYTSLSDRFGIRIPFLALSRKEYLEMVDGLVELAGLEIEPEFLKAESQKWEIAHGGRTPRAARQFVEYLSYMK